MFNLKHQLSYDTLKQLKPVTDLQTMIYMKEGLANSSLLLTHLCPKMVLVLRDNQVSSKTEAGDERTSKEYLEH